MQLLISSKLWDFIFTCCWARCCEPCSFVVVRSCPCRRRIRYRNLEECERNSCCHEVPPGTHQTDVQQSRCHGWLPLSVSHVCNFQPRMSTTTRHCLTAQALVAIYVPSGCWAANMWQICLGLQLGGLTTCGKNLIGCGKKVFFAGPCANRIVVFNLPGHDLDNSCSQQHS